MTDKTRPHRWLWRIVQVSLLLFLLGVVRQWWRYSSTVEQGRRDLAAVLAEIDEADPRWRWADLEADRPALPDDLNSLVAVKRHLQAWHAVYGPRMFMPSPMPDPLLWPDDLNTLDDPLLFPMDRTTIVSLGQALRERPRGKATIHLATDVISTEPPHLADCGEALQLLAPVHELQLWGGRTHDAVDGVHALLHLGAALRDDAFYHAQYTRHIIREVARNRTLRLLGLSEPSEDDLASLQAHFEAEVSEPLLRTALRGHRAMWHEWYERLQRGDLPLGESVDTLHDVLYWRRPEYTSPVQRYFAGVRYRQHLEEDHAAFLRWMTEAVAITDRPIEQQDAAWTELKQRITPSGAQDSERQILARELVSHLFSPKSGRLQENLLVQQERLRSLCAALAAERFRKAHQRWPRSLGELVPRYLSAVPSAAHTGDPLRFETLPDGVLIYSPHPDVTRMEQETILGYGFRLWDPLHRRVLLPVPPRRDSDPPPPPPEPHQ
jgi:hypothetical protein